jgi:hypothetical protein
VSIADRELPQERGKSPHVAEPVAVARTKVVVEMNRAV